MRLLYFRDADDGVCIPVQASGADPPGGPGRRFEKPLPLHRLQRHRPSDRGRGRTMSTVSMPDRERIGRREDARLLAGAAQYVGDVEMANVLEAVIVRSVVAHGIVRGITLDAARAVPGVVDAFAAGDLGAYLAPLPARFPPPPGLEPLLQFPLARDRVRYVAEDAAQLVEAEIDMLPAVSDVESAL